MTDTTTRLLGNDDWTEALRLGAEAFGGKRPDTAPESWPPPGQTGWGTFVGERMVARLAGRDYHSWFDGVQVPTLGVAGVCVEAEHRGQGLLRELFARLLADSDAPISTLFPTASGIYRGFGYEVVGALRVLEAPTARLAGVRRPDQVTTRRATKNDLPAVEACWARWASAQNGPLTRTGPLFDIEDLLNDVTGTSLAIDADGEVIGFATWDRGTGYDRAATLRVHDLVADTADAARALWQMLASFGSVTGQVRLTTSGEDTTLLQLPSATWQETHVDPYMLRILDVSEAFSLRRPSAAIRADLAFGVRGDRLGLIDGDYRLLASDGTVECSRALAADRIYTPAGIALAYAGTQNSANLRRAGLLTGPTDDDPVWDALLGGRQFHVRDYF